jgi:hypothetical protein
MEKDVVAASSAVFTSSVPGRPSYGMVWFPVELVTVQSSAISTVQRDMNIARLIIL